ncbi:MAG: hypothetical protein JKY65_02110 [Planctomycetes bacterium]|nr:hypothetical protein [Planctomycetota bacterium]
MTAEVKQPTPRRRTRRILFRLFVLLVSSAIALVLIEVGLSIFAPQRMGQPGLEPLGGILVPRPDLRGRDFAPGDFDVQVSTNSQRFRGQREYEMAPKAGTTRVLVLGDSFVYGVGAGDSETYPHQLEQLLNEGQTTFEVINAGIYGSGTGEQVVWYEQWPIRFEPALVVLTVYENDFQDDRRRPAFVLKGEELAPRTRADLQESSKDQASLRSITRRLPGYTYLSQHSHLLNLLRRAATVGLRPPEASQPALAVEPAAEGPKRNLLHHLELKRLEGVVSGHGGRLVVVYIPSRAAIWETSPPPESNHVIASLTESCQELGLQFEDLTTVMRREYTAEAPLYFKGDMHCTPAGYHAVARGVSAFLQREGLGR